MKSAILPISAIVLVVAQGCGVDVATDGPEITGETEQAFTFSREFVFRRFVEGYKFKYKGYKSTCQAEIGQTLRVEHYSRYSPGGKYHLYSAVDLQPGESHESCNDARRTKVIVSGSMPEECYDYEIEAWNCS